MTRGSGRTSTDAVTSPITLNRVRVEMGTTHSTGGSTLTLGPARGREFGRLMEFTRSVAAGSRQSRLHSVARKLVADGRIQRMAIIYY